VIAQPIGELMQKRYEKFRKLGKFTEGEVAKETVPAQQL